MRIGITALACVSILVAAAALPPLSDAQYCRPLLQGKLTPLPATAQGQISGALGRDEDSYHARAQSGGFRMENRRVGLSAEFTQSGVTFRAGEHQWGVALRGYGYGEKLRAASVVAPHSAANRIEYRRDGLTDWYVNGPLGLEQGFTLERAPTGSQLEPLTVVFDLSGDLDAAVDPDERGLTLEKAGTAVLRYRGLTAMDAGGRELRAWLEVVDRR